MSWYRYLSKIYYTNFVVQDKLALVLRINLFLRINIKICFNSSKLAPIRYVNNKN